MTERSALHQAHGVALFVEGTDSTDEKGSDRLTKLWRYLADCCGHRSLSSVHGFSKNQIVLMAPDADPKGLAKLPLDRLIARKQADEGFQSALVAFDRFPENQRVPHDSMRNEVNWILERMVVRKVLPPQLLHDAGKLLKRYRTTPCPARAQGRSSHFSIEFIYMDPMFEGLLVVDGRAVLRALGIERKPKDWPTFDPNNREPGRDIVAPAVRYAEASVRAKVRDSFKTNKHGWAHWIVEHAECKEMRAHPIWSRLCSLLA